MSEMDLSTNLSLKIRKIREIKGFSQDYVATKMNITQNTYSKIERGETSLTINKLLDICNALEVDIKTLMSFDEKMVFTNCTQSGNFGENNTFIFNTIDKVQELYDRIIKLKEDEIQRLNEIINKKK